MFVGSEHALLRIRDGFKIIKSIYGSVMNIPDYFSMLIMRCEY
jgi:hypothetical protein